jgi:hypothetical protein
MTFTNMIRSKSNDVGFYDQINAKECLSVLEIPDGRNCLQNAWLTITINYSLDFVDKKNLSNYAYIKAGKAYAKDANEKEIPLRDWDSQSTVEFNRRFAKAEEFWNYKFLLLTPADYSGLDFNGIGPLTPILYTTRPNVICLFRLKSGGNPTHLSIKVVRPDFSGWDKFWNNDFFRSDKLHYAESAVANETVWHELGHALDQLHIKALKGDKKCLVDINADRCYDGPNIMGKGKDLEPVNARAWRELIWHHTGVHQNRWVATMAVNTPPRIIYANNLDKNL